jgi:hypothetical protein
VTRRRPSAYAWPAPPNHSAAHRALRLGPMPLGHAPPMPPARLGRSSHNPGGIHRQPRTPKGEQAWLRIDHEWTIGILATIDLAANSPTQPAQAACR